MLVLIPIIITKIKLHSHIEISTTYPSFTLNYVQGFVNGLMIRLKRGLEGRNNLLKIVKSKIKKDDKVFGCRLQVWENTNKGLPVLEKTERKISVTS